MARILVVDDEPVIADLLERFLKMSNFEVSKAVGGEEAIRILSTDERFDLMVLDVKMPKVNALGVMRKKAELGKEFPVFLLTGTIEEQKHIDEMGMYGLCPEDILYKPIDFPELVDKIKKKLSIP